MKCRHCNADTTLSLIDLGSAPPSNAYLSSAQLHAPEKWYPLRVLVCSRCWLAQTEDYAAAEEMFSADYAYFSSFAAPSWLGHAKRYVAAMIERFTIGQSALVAEIAANDGYLLQYVKERGIPCYGVEPTAGTAQAARDKGIDIVEAFFGTDLATRLAAQGRRADLITANNVLAHVPDINDFIRGFPILLKPDGVVTFEFSHLLKLVENNQFDTIYHEHFSYLSLCSVVGLFRAGGLEVFDVEELPTQGGSLRVFAQRADSGTQPVTDRVENLLAHEKRVGLTTENFYRGFQARVEAVKHEFLSFLLDCRRAKLKVAAYGAAAKGNTLLNFAGVRPDLLPYVVDHNPAKIGNFLPGSRIPIVDEERLIAKRPDRVVILPWNLREDVMARLAYVRDWGGQFVVAIPHLEIL